MSTPKINRNELMEQARPTGASQATAIEQTRAVAQVQGALVVAQQRPRDTMAAAQRMREACQTTRLAEKAFFAYDRGGSTVKGASIHLATELARCWGNMDYGIVELARDDDEGVSEMMSYAWDLETNMRSSNTFIVPHRRDTRTGAKALTDQRDIYENNANNAARRLRECIFRTMPKAFTEEAQELCRATLEHGGGRPIAEQREKLVEAFAAINISSRRVSKRVGKAIDKLTAFDLGELRIAYRSITTGEALASELFPDDSGEAATDALKKARDQDPPKPADDTKPPADPPADDAQDGSSDAVSLILPGSKKPQMMPRKKAAQELVAACSQQVGPKAPEWLKAALTANAAWLREEEVTLNVIEGLIERFERDMQGGGGLDV